MKRKLPPGRSPQDILLQGPFASCPSCLQTLSAFSGLTPPLWGPPALAHLRFPMLRVHLLCLCLAAWLPGVSVACACVSARTRYL